MDDYLRIYARDGPLFSICHSVKGETSLPWRHLLKALSQAPEALRGYTHIILDEVHEQSATFELLLVLLKTLLPAHPAQGAVGPWCLRSGQFWVLTEGMDCGFAMNVFLGKSLMECISDMECMLCPEPGRVMVVLSIKGLKRVSDHQPDPGADGVLHSSFKERFHKCFWLVPIFGDREIKFQINLLPGYFT